MRFDAQAVMDAQRRAYNNLASKMVTMPDGSTVENAYYTPANKITMPAQIIQELPFTNQTNIFTFNFASNGPATTPALGNVLIGKTQVLSVYAIQLLVGQGANANTRIYRSRGVTANDDGIYNSTLQMKFETSSNVDNFNGYSFKDVATNANETWAEMGMALINPIRIVNGELGKFEVSINLINSIAGVVLTADLFLSLRLWGALGQPKG